MLNMPTKNGSWRCPIYDFVEHLNNNLDNKNNLDKDVIMKSCLVLSDIDPKYKVSNFTKSNLKIIESNWRNIKKGLESTLRLVNRFGIDRENLSSVNALLPIAYYLYRLGRGSLDGSTPFEAKNSKLIHRWLLGSLLNGVFAGNSDNTIKLSRSIIQEALKTGQDFPYQALVQGLVSRGRVTTFDDNNIEGLLETKYGSRICFLALSLLYDGQNWGSGQHHVDHIVPQSLGNRKALMALNIPESRIQKILDSVNGLGNLQLLLGRENLEKSNTPFTEWIRTRDRGFLDQHLIPDDPDLWNVEALPEFVKAREKLIRQRLRQLNFKVDEPALGN